MSIEDALNDTLSSPNEFDTNGEQANVVDGLFAIARAITRLAKTIEGTSKPPVRTPT